MTQEPKSIFTAKRSFASQAEQDRIADIDAVKSAKGSRGIVAVSSDGKGHEELNSTATTTENKILQGTLLRQAQWGGIGAERGSTTTVSPRADIQKIPVKIPKKRKHSDVDDSFPVALPASEPRPKKSQTARIRPRHTLDPATFPTGFHTNISQPPSPLFFSYTQRQRPTLPHGFSSSEAAAKMLNKVKDEPSGVTTLKLARGSISNSSPPRTSATPGSSRFSDRGSLPRSPDPAATQSGLQVLQGVGVVELIDQDDRPTLILDLANAANWIPGGPLRIVFANAALKASESTLDMVMGKTDLNSPGVVINTFPEFKAWALSFVKNQESLDVCLPSFIYGGLTWTCSTLRKRLRVLSGSACSSTTTTATTNMTTSSIRAPSTSSLRSETMPDITGSTNNTEGNDYFGDVNSVKKQPTTSPLVSEVILESVEAPQKPIITSSISQTVLGMSSDPSLANEAMIAAQSAGLRDVTPVRSETASFDWTRLPNNSLLPRHIQFARSIDWGETALGPIESWGFDLRTMCNMIMGSPHPAAMYWGSDYTAIYNEAYILLAGQKHPALMGQSYKVGWSEIWNEGIAEVFESAWSSGQATMKDDDCLFIMRNGYLEESYFSWSIIPLVGEDGSVVGLYNPAFEKTRRKIAERRMLTLREVGEKTARAQKTKEFWGEVMKGLEYNEYDVPFAFIYSVSDESDSDLSSINSGSLMPNPQCVLEATLGVPEGHPAAISPLDLKTSGESFAPYFREAMKTNRPILLTTEDDTLSSELIAGLGCRGFGDPCRAAIVCPILPTTGDNILGFLIMGINPRRPYDDDYSLFIQLLTRQLATSMASVVLFEEEIRRGQRAARLAALDRIELSKQLDLRTQEAMESETKFTRMAEFAPVGMFIADSTGRITYSNDTWWEISRHPKEENSADSWMDSIKDDDRPQLEAMWKRIVVDKHVVTHEFRFKTPWRDSNGLQGDTWVLMSAYPEQDGYGGLKSVFGSITDISQQKFAEDFQKRRMEEAVELKRQQENFIDITSHEMRNPLSAILQSADEISTSLSEYRSGTQRTSRTIDEVIDASLDAAQTIALCAQHQKRIVDDILTLSKLDSALLLVTPVETQPEAVVQRALKMFEGELETNDISMEFRIEESYRNLSVDWVKLDPSRLLQVLINLTTNAIKFTHTQEKRTIVVSIGASLQRPCNDSGYPLPDSNTKSGLSYFPTRSKRKDLTSGADWGTGEEVYLTFAVQDTGRGLDEDEKKLLFIRFSQTSPRTHVQYGGSGLGLFISRELTELQGGEIGVSSERGVGSTFAFYVKARRTASPKDLMPPPAEMTRRNSNISKQSTVKAIQASKTNNSRPKPPQADRPAVIARTSSLERNMLKVLIVEDNIVNSRVLNKNLRNLGCVTYVANHGGEALEHLERSRWWKGVSNEGIELSVVLMDLEMPVMDGLTCARRIRALQAEGTIIGHVPIIAVTANARSEQIATAIEAGMDDVVSKPFRIPELIPKIEELVAKHKSI